MNDFVVILTTIFAIIGTLLLSIGLHKKDGDYLKFSAVIFTIAICFTCFTYPGIQI